MTAVLKVIDRICLAGAAAAAVLLSALFVLGFTEILLRSIFSISLPFAVEYAGYLLVLVLFLGSGWTLAQGGHIRVTLLSEHVSQRTAHKLDVVCTFIALFIAGLWSVSMIDFALGTWQRGTLSYFASETPLAIPQGLLAIGPCILTLALSARLVRLVRNDQAAHAESPSNKDDHQGSV